MGDSPAEVTTEDIEAAVAKVQEAKDAGQIRRFTGNDYGDDLVAGNVAIAQAYSGDVAQLKLDNPDLEFVFAEEGMISWSDNMVLPITTRELDRGRGVDELRLRPGERGPDHRPTSSTSRRWRARARSWSPSIRSWPRTS